MTTAKPKVCSLHAQLGQAYQELKELEEEIWLLKDEIASLEQQLEEAEGEDYDE